MIRSITFPEPESEMPEPFVDTLVNEIRYQLEATLPRLSDRLLPAGASLIRDSAVQLESWASQAASGELTESDVRWLVRSKLDLRRLEALRVAGLTQVEVDLFRQAITRTVIGMLVGRLAALNQADIAVVVRTWKVNQST